MNASAKPILSLVKTALEEIGSNLTTPRDSRHCCTCWRSIALEENSPRWRDLDIKCDECSKAEQEKAEDQQRNQIRFRLSAIPPAYLKTERSKLPFPEKLDEAMHWEYGPSGLLLFGPTGCGKSRIAWQVARREAEKGKVVKGVGAFELAKYPAMLMAEGDVATKFSDSMAEASLLLLDDVFKAKPTERVEELLFAVIEERGQRELPCIITLNDTGETLANRLSQDRGAALIRRLRDYCQPINF